MFFVKSFVFVIKVHREFTPVNYPLSPPSPVSCPYQMPSDEFKISLGNMKFFLLKGKLDLRSNLCNIQQSNFGKSKI